MMWYRIGPRMMEKLPVLVVIMVLAVLLLSCSGTKNNKSENPFFDKWREAAEKSKGFTPTRKKVTPGVSDKRFEGLAKEDLKAKSEKPLPTKRVTVKLRDLEVSTALRAVAKAADQNIVINEAIKGTVTVDVKNSPWDQVFVGILRSHGLSYSWEGDILRIMTASDKTRETKEVIRTMIVPIEYADAKALRDNIQGVLTTSETRSAEGGRSQNIDKKTGSVLVDQHNNALIIQANMEDIQRLLPIIEALDRPTSQILIEAHIVEATKDTARELGVQWGGLLHQGNQWIYPGANTSIVGADNSATGPISSTPTPAQPGVMGMGIGAPTGQITGQFSNFPAQFTQGIAPGWGYAGLTLGYMLGFSGQSLLSAQLSALQTDGKLNILSSPSVTTLDNQAALIESGKEVPFQTVDENGKIVIQWKKATLKLDVTPHVIDGRILKMKIQTKKDELDFSRTVQGNPTIITKNAETNVILADGETTVIGGLNKETGQDGETGVPGLKDIPFLGWLFKSDRTANAMEEVLIFVTPYILPCQDLAGGECRKVKVSSSLGAAGD